ncbi:MAG: hypothetical protein Q7R40_18145 [Phaeospirillum sp.]|nr:hypothetical protein [Phaeospirillum sp.]
MENREMFDEINALVGAVAKAMEISEGEVIAAIEQGRLGMEMIADEQGRNCIEVTSDGRTARVYQGAIFRPDDQPGDEDCESGCSCGH